MKKLIAISLCVAFATLGLQGSAQAGSLSQWATSATATEEYGTGLRASDATGEPNSFGQDCKDGVNAWALAAFRNQGSLTLTYATAVVPTSLKIHQIYSRGGIWKIEVSANNSTWTSIYTSDPNLAVSGTCDENDILKVNVTKVSTPIKYVRLSVDQTESGRYTEIDAVQLIGLQKTAQTIGAVASSVKVGATLTLPAKTSKALSITWTSSTKSICTISAGKVKGIKKGTCKISGTNAGNADYLAVTAAKTISVK